MSIAAAIGLVIVFGGRIIPSFTDAILTSRADVPLTPRWRAIEAPAAILASAALASWVASPGGRLTALLCAAAALLQCARLAQWRPLSIIDTPNVYVLHAAYAFVPLGFALVAAQSILPPGLVAGAAIHAWTVGAVGLMSLAVMMSMVRRQTGHAHESTPLAATAYILCGAAGAARIAAVVPGSVADMLLVAAAVFWIGAFGIFLVVIRSMLRVA
jgi:uncharacterized protein involved in response to NO